MEEKTGELNLKQIVRWSKHRKDCCMGKKSRTQLIHETIDLKALSRVSGVRTPSLNDCVVTNKTFCIVLLCYLVQIPLFFSTVGFSNEDNRCHSQRIRKLIEEKLLKGIFKVDKLINVAASTQH